MNGYSFPSAKDYSVKRTVYRVDDFNGLNLMSDPNTLPLSYARNAYNVSFENGMITNGYGVRSGFVGMGILQIRAIITMNPKKIWPWKVRGSDGNAVDKLLILCGDASGMRKNRVYAVDLETAKNVYAGLELEDGADAIGMRFTYNGENIFVLYKSTGGGCIVKNGYYEQFDGTPSLISICSHYSRVFGIESGANVNRIVFSAPENPTNFNVSATEGGYIGVGNEAWGMLKVVKSFKDYVYVFSQRGIYRLTAYADQSSFKLAPVTSFRGNLRENTVTDCGDRIVFLTDEAMYSFDGFTTQRLINDNFNMITDSSAAVTAWDGEKLFLACAVKRDDLVLGDEYKTTSVNNAVLIVDPKKNSAEVLRGPDVEYFYFLEYNGVERLMTALRGRINELAHMEKGLGKFIGQELCKRWATSETDFLEPGMNKRLRRVTLRSKYDLTLKLVLDGSDYTYKIKGSDAWQSVYVNMIFDEMSLEFLVDVIPAALSSDIEINGFSLEVEFSRRYKDGL